MLEGGLADEEGVGKGITLAGKAVAPLVAPGSAAFGKGKMFSFIERCASSPFLFSTKRSRSQPLAFGSLNLTASTTV